MTESYKKVSFNDLMSLPKLEYYDFGWTCGTKPSILVLCKNDKDKSRLFEYLVLNKRGYNAYEFISDDSEMIGIDGFAIFKSKNFENEKIFNKAIQRVISRCGGHSDFCNVWVVEE